jgi:hypothetical protein
VYLIFEAVANFLKSVAYIIKNGLGSGKVMLDSFVGCNGGVSSRSRICLNNGVEIVHQLHVIRKLGIQILETDLEDNVSPGQSRDQVASVEKQRSFMLLHRWGVGISGRGVDEKKPYDPELLE